MEEERKRAARGEMKGYDKGRVEAVWSGGDKAKSPLSICPRVRV